MWINLGIWLSRLRWSSFPITHTWKDLVLTFQVTVTSRSLSLNYLSENRSDRLQLIESLFESGHTDKQIAEILNERKILTPRGGKYYYELVFVTRRKFRLRKEREKLDDLFRNVDLTIEQIKKFKLDIENGINRLKSKIHSLKPFKNSVKNHKFGVFKDIDKLAIDSDFGMYANEFKQRTYAESEPNLKEFFET